MSDIVKGVLSGAWTLVVGWILPSAVTLAIFGLFVLPSFRATPLFERAVTASAGNKALILLVSSVLGGWVLSAVQTPLYRVLEGYLLWPSSIRQIRIRHHQELRRKLENESRTDTPEASDQGEKQNLFQELLLERLFRYPEDEQQVAPTMLGNAIRRLEYYGQDRYELDSQRLWYQLCSVVPESLTKDVDNARAGVDFFVCLIYTLGGLAATSLLALALNASDWPRLSLTGVLAVSAAVCCYAAAVVATDAWAAAVRAMVDLGRLPLAMAYGLKVPDQLEDERTMWRALGWLLKFPYHKDAAKAIDPYRQSSVGRPAADK